MTDFLILGGGVIGMLLARELAPTGAQITLIERKICAQEATWAGGGIVSPLYPWRYPDAVTALATWSQSSYIHLAQNLLTETGIDPELRQKGMLMVDVDDQNDALVWAQQYHRPLRLVEADFAYEKEPNLIKGIEQALWMPEVCSIRNPRFGKSLRTSLLKYKNIKLLEYEKVTSINHNNGHVKSVTTNQNKFAADKIVIAAGAWSAELLAMVDKQVAVEPVRGQMMLFKATNGLVNRIILKTGRYLIPRNDGRILVGSTLEKVGFDYQTTKDAAASLHATALDIVPALANFPIEHHWAGLRPGSPAGIPFIGAVPEFDNLFINAGQFRNGLVLAPASVRLLADIMLQRSPIVNPEPYALNANR